MYQLTRKIANFFSKYYLNNRPEEIQHVERPIYYLNTTKEISDQIQSILKQEEENFKKNSNQDKIIFPARSKLEALNIHIVENDPIINRYGEEKLDCQDWAFTTLNLKKYTARGIYGTKLDDLLTQDSETLKLIRAPIEGALVMYFKKPKDIISHFAIVSKITPKGDVIVKSKWGYDKLLEHRLDYVPKQYGDKVAFFEKIEK